MGPLGMHVDGSLLGARIGGESHVFPIKLHARRQVRFEYKSGVILWIQKYIMYFISYRSKSQLLSIWQITQLMGLRLWLHQLDLRRQNADVNDNR